MLGLPFGTHPNHRHMTRRAVELLSRILLARARLLAGPTEGPMATLTAVSATLSGSKGGAKSLIVTKSLCKTVAPLITPD